MRPRKSVLLYHPDKDETALLRYAMEITLAIHAHVAKSADELLNGAGDIEVTVLWTKRTIEIRNLQAGTFRTIPRDSSRLDLMEAIRTGLARRSGRRGVHKDRDEKQAAVLVTRVREVTEEIDIAERMMHLACPKRKRFAA